MFSFQRTPKYLQRKNRLKKMIKLTVLLKRDTGTGMLKTVQKGTFDIEMFKNTFDRSETRKEDMNWIETDEDWVDFIISNQFIKNWVIEYIPYITNPISEINPYGIGSNITILEWYRDGKLVRRTE